MFLVLSSSTKKLLGHDGYLCLLHKKKISSQLNPFQIVNPSCTEEVPLKTNICLALTSLKANSIQAKTKT